MGRPVLYVILYVIMPFLPVPSLYRSSDRHDWGSEGMKNEKHRHRKAGVRCAGLSE